MAFVCRDARRGSWLRKSCGSDGGAGVAATACQPLRAKASLTAPFGLYTSCLQVGDANPAVRSQPAGAAARAWLCACRRQVDGCIANGGLGQEGCAHVRLAACTWARACP